MKEFRTIVVEGVVYVRLNDVINIAEQPIEDAQIDNTPRYAYVLAKFKRSKWIGKNQLIDLCKKSRLFNGRSDTKATIERMIDEGFLSCESGYIRIKKAL